MRPSFEFEVILKEDKSRIFLEVTGGDILLPTFKGLIGQTFLASIFKTYRRRTDRQNRYVWGVIVPCVQSWMKETTGDIKTSDEIYYFLRSIVGSKLEIVYIAGNTVPVLSGKRFSQMSTVEFSDAVEKIYSHFAEKGLAIPPPTGENLLSDFVRVR